MLGVGHPVRQRHSVVLDRQHLHLTTFKMPSAHKFSAACSYILSDSRFPLHVRFASHCSATASRLYLSVFSSFESRRRYKRHHCLLPLSGHRSSSSLFTRLAAPLSRCVLVKGFRATYFLLTAFSIRISFETAVYVTYIAVVLL